jgi:GNAT superfamily N-acetyltransferase
VLRLSHLFVAPAHRRRGVGSALVEAALARDGVDVELIAHEANTGAITFWQAQGFSGWGALQFQSSSASRLTAGAAGFLTFTQQSARPER